MTVKELKDLLVKLPADMDEWPVVMERCDWCSGSENNINALDVHPRPAGGRREKDESHVTLRNH